MDEILSSGNKWGNPLRRDERCREMEMFPGRISWKGGLSIDPLDSSKKLVIAAPHYLFHASDPDSSPRKNSEEMQCGDAGPHGENFLRTCGGGSSGASDPKNSLGQAISS